MLIFAPDIQIVYAKYMQIAQFNDQFEVVTKTLIIYSKTLTVAGTNWWHY